jgi:NAD(P)-dependent dehydrogenase (short-subunit alcohol dehydrogenase family)
MRLQNKVTLITGSATGIGKSVAMAFAKEGALLGLYDINESMGKSTLEEIKGSGGEAIFLQGDVSNASDVKRAVEKVVDQYHRIDVLVNNAAFAIKGTIATITEEEWDRQIDVNLKSVYLFSHLVIPIMADQGGGVIINTGSVTSLVGVPDFAAYVASKTGMLGITRAMSLDHASQNIRVNIICPSGIKTPLMEWQFQNAPNPDLERKRVTDLHPLGRMGEPDELAQMFIYLASDEARYITGSVFQFDGGYTAR